MYVSPHPDRVEDQGYVTGKDMEDVKSSRFCHSFQKTKMCEHVFFFAQLIFTIQGTPTFKELVYTILNGFLMQTVEKEGIV